MWKFLRDKQVLHTLKETAIRKIQMLGNGHWRGRLCKPLEGLPKQHDMKLYEARLTKGGRILWELAVAFSPRCSDDCDKRLDSGKLTVFASGLINHFLVFCAVCLLISLSLLKRSSVLCKYRKSYFELYCYLIDYFIHTVY